ncbi:hypothetical protein Rhe02_85960 [Rhizocola hellebori]|uniref:LLM class flavin-dependent oxidoreductase n=1 Tax=Rhizocola hellebori TaxID=1392758 RepID=A0A8J3QGB9_9ACTN|nr:hypothetical protein [Rhizocola hellebori]GIH10529.1 hypothetical protein Rhe02_85960 [Rhizocola hellebori]
MKSNIKVGVVLARRADDLAEWLADAASFDAAGADALWIDVVGHSELDPLVLTAALAVTTGRSLLVADLGPHREEAAALATVERLSRGRLRTIGGGFRLLDEETQAYEHIVDGQAERWVPTPAGQARDTWQATLAQAAAEGVSGLLVPAWPGLLDLLRNPGDPGQRHDLELTVG